MFSLDMLLPSTEGLMQKHNSILKTPQSLFASNITAIISTSLPEVYSNCLYYTSVNHMPLTLSSTFFCCVFFNLLSFCFSVDVSGERVKKEKLNPSIESEVDQSGVFFFLHRRKFLVLFFLF